MPTESKRPAKRKWTKKDLRRFDELVALMDSPRQMDRIEGRLEWHNFADKFSRAELDEMWELIK